MENPNSLKRAVMVAALCATLLVAGCSQRKAYYKLQTQFPDSQITNVPGEDYQWLIQRPDGSLWYVEFFGFSSTEEVLPIRLFDSRQDEGLEP
jgi:hypothetical protein